MMKYISARTWRDLTDKHLYHEGDFFPFDGRDVPEERLKELESGHNRAGLQMIRGIITEDEPEPVPEPASEPEQEVKKAPAKRQSRAAKKK